MIKMEEAVIGKKYRLIKVHQYQDTANWHDAILLILNKSKTHLRLSWLKKDSSEGHDEFSFPSDGWRLEDLSGGWDV